MSRSRSLAIAVAQEIVLTIALVAIIDWTFKAGGLFKHYGHLHPYNLGLLVFAYVGGRSNVGRIRALIQQIAFGRLRPSGEEHLVEASGDERRLLDDVVQQPLAPDHADLEAAVSESRLDNHAVVGASLSHERRCRSAEESHDLDHTPQSRDVRSAAFRCSEHSRLPISSRRGAA